MKNSREGLNKDKSIIGNYKRVLKDFGGVLRSEVFLQKLEV